MVSRRSDLGSIKVAFSAVISMPAEICRWCQRVFGGKCVRRREGGAECKTCCALIREEPFPFHTDKGRKHEEQTLRNDPEEQRKWDRRVEEKEAAPTRNGKKHGCGSSACSGSAVVSTCMAPRWHQTKTKKQGLSKRIKNIF